MLPSGLMATNLYRYDLGPRHPRPVPVLELDNIPVVRLSRLEMLREVNNHLLELLVRELGLHVVDQPASDDIVAIHAGPSVVKV